MGGARGGDTRQLVSVAFLDPRRMNQPVHLDEAIERCHEAVLEAERERPVGLLIAW